MLKRIITGGIMLLVVLPLALINSFYTEILFLFLVMFLGFYASFEFNRAIKCKSYLNPVICLIIVVLSCNATNQLSLYENFDGFIYLLLFYVFSIFIIFGYNLFKKDSSALSISYSLLNITYCGLFLGLSFSIRYLNPFNINLNNITLSGPKAFIYVYTIVLLTDTFAYLIGTKFGKHKLAPHISPKKSVEGSIGGLVFGTIFGTVSLVIYSIISIKDLNYLFIGILVSLIISICVQLGDLVESKIKRSFEIKDFGNILPGHGGILDRFDSFIYSGTIFLIFTVLLEVLLIWKS